MRENKRKLGLVPKLIIAIVLGILIGQFLPSGCHIIRTFQYIFKIRHSADDSCLCHYGNRGSVSGCR